jgi:hypothetical protein
MSGGGAKCWGDNRYGQVGDGTTEPRLVPVDVWGLSAGVSALSAGDYHTCAVTIAGGIKCWGWNDWGQIGDGTLTSREKPVFVIGIGPPPPRRLTVSKAGSGTGTISSSPAGITCGGVCSYDFIDGDVVTLTATASAGSSFSGWTGDCSGTGTCALAMGADHSVTATFESDKTLTVVKSGKGSGSVVSSPTGLDCGATCSHAYSHGTSVTLTATVAPGSKFSGWSDDCSGVGSCTLTMSADHSAITTFDLLCVVPNMRRKTLVAAKAVLKTAHCSLGKVQKATSKKKKGTVIAQSPPPGKTLAEGAKVNVVLSKGQPR